MSNSRRRPLYDLPRKQLKILAKEMAKESKTFGTEFIEHTATPLGFRGYDRNGSAQILKAAYRNRYFCVQIYEQGTWLRISVNRAELDVEKNTWKEGITWDQLMDIKDKLGYGDRDAIEIYPRNSDVVDVTNMRHLFILPEDHNIDCIWRK